jgi:hypothetical protein
MKGNQKYMQNFSLRVVMDVVSLRDLDVSEWIILNCILID